MAVALGVGALAVAASVFVLVATFLLRLKHRSRLERERRFAAQWRPLLAACAEEVPAALPMLDRADAAQFLGLWVHTQESVRGEVQARLVQLAERVGADRLAVEFLGSGRLALELPALVAVGHLRLRGLLPLVQALARADSPVISLAAAQVLLRVDASAGLPSVIALAAEREDWPLSRLAAMLRECGDGTLDAALAGALETALAAAAAERLTRLLRLAGAVRPEAARPAIVRVLQAGAPPEVLGAALDAAWHPDEAALVRRHARDTQWHVRLAAAKALARIGTGEDRELLQGMLSDANWWVRYRAAQALARLPGMALADLQRLRSQVSDRFAADMLGQVIAELGDA